MALNLSISSYVDFVRATGATAAGLAQQLTNAAPEDASTEEKHALTALKQAGHDVALVNHARQRAAPATVRPVLLALNGAWMAAFEVATGKARISADISDVASKAEQILVSIFFDGVPVSQSTALEAWTASTGMLERMESEKLVKTFEAVVGHEVLVNIRKCTAALGEEIGTGGKRVQTPSSTALQEALARFGRKVARYCRILAANIDEDEPKSVERFLSAVQPIDAYRASMRGGVSVDDAPVDAVTPPTTTSTSTSNGSTPAVTAADVVTA